MKRFSLGNFSHKSKGITNTAFLGLLVLVMLLIASYSLTRNSGHFGEGDTSAFTNFTYYILKTEHLIPIGDVKVYSNGFGYQALLVYLIHFSGLALFTIQTLVVPFLAAWLIVPAWLCFREFTMSPRAAFIATVLLIIQPEFLFPIMRGTHEKFTRGLMFICMYLFLKSLRTSPQLRNIIKFVISFYFVCTALITFNSFMASSFILGFGLSIGLAMLAMRRMNINSPVMLRLFFITISLVVITYIFTFYIYPPAIRQLNIFSSTLDRVTALVLQVEDSTINPYEVINFGWISPEIYLLVSLSNWLLLVFSCPIWIIQTWNLLIKRKKLPAHKTLLWAFFGAFVFQGLISVIIDFSGAIAANLQHRMFPSFVMFACPLLASWLVDVSLFRQIRKQPYLRTFTRISLGAILTCLTLLTLLKATTEPLLSNFWTFYVTAELPAVNWAVENLRYDSIWTDYTERLRSAFIINTGPIPDYVHLGMYDMQETTRYILVSKITLLRSHRLQIPLIIPFDSLRIYDNGSAAIYHNQPNNQFQK